MNIGSHVSIAGGFSKCIDRIADLGGNCLMTFASSPRSLQTKAVTDKEIELYLKKKKEKNIGTHFFHGVYLVNLATGKKDYLKVSINSLTFYQQLAGQIGGMGTIFHIGSHTGAGFDKVSDQIAKSINEVLDNTPKGIKLYLENSAGQAGTVGSFEEIAQILARIGDKSKIGVCLDTQHMFAAGIDLDHALTTFDHIVGLKHLGVIHFNDSKTDFGSHLDRHENIGKGKIGREVLQKFINDSRLKNIPFILEVPGDGDGPTKKDVDAAKALVLK